MNAVSLFSGIGGIDLAAEWAGIKTVAMCEREPFCQKVLKKHWPDVPIYDDVCTLTKERLEADGVGTIELIHGGYPCQPFSLAGERKGERDDRHLWPEVRRLIEAVRPRWFVGENVAGHVTLGLDDVLSDLDAIGYTARAFVFPAAAVGATHRRDRVFIVGYAERIGRSGKSWGGAESESPNGHIELESGNVADTASKGLPIWGRSEWPKSEEETRAGVDAKSKRCGEVLAHASSSGQQECDVATFTDQSGYSARGIDTRRAIRTIESRVGRVLDGLSAGLDGYWPAGRGQEQYEWEPPRVKNGVKNRTGRIKSLGNAVVPKQIYPILAAIKQIDDALREATP